MNGRLKEGLRSLLPRSLARHRILGGPLRGSAIVTSWHDYPAAILGKTELALLKWFGKNVGEGETWLDIGAHYGYTSIALCKLVGSAGHVYAFEPMLNTAGCVTRTRLLNDLAAIDSCADCARKQGGFGHGQFAIGKGDDRQHAPGDEGLSRDVHDFTTGLVMAKNFGARFSDRRHQDRCARHGDRSTRGNGCAVEALSAEIARGITCGGIERAVPRCPSLARLFDTWSSGRAASR